jgi:hypothetical protein
MWRYLKPNGDVCCQTSSPDALCASCRSRLEAGEPGRVTSLSGVPPPPSLFTVLRAQASPVNRDGVPVPPSLFRKEK